MGEADYPYSVHIKGTAVLQVLFLKPETAPKSRSGEAGQPQDEKSSSGGEQRVEAAQQGEQGPEAPKLPKVGEVSVQERGTASWPSCCLATWDCKIITVVHKELALIRYLFIFNKILFAESINLQEEKMRSVPLR